MKKMLKMALLTVLVISLAVPAALAQTRETVIYREGEGETVTEQLLESSFGFSVWYPNELLEAYEGEMGNMEGVIVTAMYSDDHMILSVIPEEDAVEYVEDLDVNIVEQSASGRVVMDIYRDLEDGRYYFLAVVAENGKYLSAVGDYSQEAAEGNGVLLDHVLQSVSFGPSGSSGSSASSGTSGSGLPVRVAWGENDDEELLDESMATVVLTVDQPLMDLCILAIEWSDMPDDGKPTFYAAPVTSWGAVEPGQTISVTLEFIGEMPCNGVAYVDEDGQAHYYVLDTSGNDGSLYLWSLDELIE